MPRPQKKDRAHVAGMVCATQVSSIAMQMAVPPGLGYLADRRWGTLPWLTVAGAGVGGILFAMEIVRLVKGLDGRRPPRGE